MIKSNGNVNNYKILETSLNIQNGGTNVGHLKIFNQSYSFYLLTDFEAICCEIHFILGLRYPLTLLSCFVPRCYCLVHGDPFCP